jgi:dTDP-4-amino-4,6-dideoxygalactose transaminase
MHKPDQPIVMVDLVRQHAPIRAELDAAMAQVLDTGAFIKGPDVHAFAEELAEYVGVKHVIPCGNGTDALQLALMALGVGPGDEVITTGFTFIATVEVVGLLGARPVLVDVNPCTFNIDAEQVERAITPRTKAIVPVHLFGQPADMDRLMAISEASGVPIVEDNAQGIGARWFGAAGKRVNAPMTGTMGALGTTSFFPSKNLGCAGDGGAVFTNDDALAERVAVLANHGMKQRYHHEAIGINSRLDTLQAAILRIKLPHLDKWNEARRAAAAAYDEHLKDIPGIRTPYRDPRSTHVFHQYTLRLDPSIDRDACVAALAAAGIPTGVYYPVPGHRQAAFGQWDLALTDQPQSDRLAASVLSLPMHPVLTDEEIQYICDCLRTFVLKN